MKKISELVSKLRNPVYFFVVIALLVIILIFVDWYSGNQVVKYLSGLLTPIIAIIAAYIAYRQYKNDNERLKRDLYEKRYAIFSNLMETIALVVHLFVNSKQHHFLTGNSTTWLVQIVH